MPGTQDDFVDNIENIDPGHRPSENTDRLITDGESQYFIRYWTDEYRTDLQEVVHRKTHYVFLCEFSDRDMLTAKGSFLNKMAQFNAGRNQEIDGKDGYWYQLEFHQR